MLIHGKCHCGNICFSLTWEPDPAEIPARACTCSFCIKHGGVWTSNPSGTLKIAVKDSSLVSTYAFGTRTAEFKVCARCGVVPVVTGFQGISSKGRVTTLGRGGSDTSAVAIAAAVKADRCDIYTDVDGVYTTDPRIEPKARRLSKISFEEMLEMASLGAKVLQVRSVELAMVHGVRTFVRSSFDDPDAPGMGDPVNPPGTLICNEDEIVEQQVVTGIAYAKDEAQISLRRVADRPGVSAGIFGPLADAGINVDMIVQNISEDGSRTDMTFTVPSADVGRALAVLETVRDTVGFDAVQHDDGMSKVSVIGIGMRSHAGVAATAFKALAEKSINIRAITTSEIKISILIDGPYTELAVRTLHSVYGLDKH